MYFRTCPAMFSRICSHILILLKLSKCCTYIGHAETGSWAKKRVIMQSKIFSISWSLIFAFSLFVLGSHAGIWLWFLLFFQFQFFFLSGFLSLFLAASRSSFRFIVVEPMKVLWIVVQDLSCYVSYSVEQNYDS